MVTDVFPNRAVRSNGPFLTSLDAAYAGASARQNAVGRVEQVDPACCVGGTAIATASGEAAIERLQTGDVLRVASGALHAIKWIERRRYARRFMTEHPQRQPIRFRAGSLGAGLPRRDLRVSPLTTLCIDGQFVAAEQLSNGGSIAPDDTAEAITYIHIEIEGAGLIVAEGVALDATAGDADRPTRSRATMAEAPAAGPLQGFIDAVERDRIIGWARNPADPAAAVRLRVSDHGVSLGEVLATRFRPDLAATFDGDPCHGFEVTVRGGLSPALRHVIEVCRVADGQALRHSPYVVEGAETPALRVLPAADGVPAGWRGALDVATRERIIGWAQQAGSADAVALQVLDNGALLARVLANQHRPDLHALGIGAGRHGFDLTIPGGLPPHRRHVIEVSRESDGAALPLSPVVIEAAGSFDTALEQAVASAVGGVHGASEQGRALAFLMAQAERLLQRAADDESEGVARWRGRVDRAGVAQAGAAPGLRALVINPNLPEAGRDDGSNALLSHITALQALGYAVSLAASDALAAGTPALAAAGIKVCAAPFYASVEEVLRRQEGAFDVVYLHRADIAARYLALARRHQPGARILYSVADLHHVRLQRQAVVEDHPALFGASQALRLAEHAAAWSADAVITHSVAEAAWLRQAVPAAQVHCVPWAVTPQPVRRPFAQRHGVAFIGHYAHPPNVDAAVWLVEAVMPLVWQQTPAITCSLAGSAMPPSVRRLERPGVRIIGAVDDVARVFGEIRLTVAPMRYGAGVKGKVLDSLAAGIPCVMTPVAAEGIALPPVLLGLVAGDAAGLAALICACHADPNGGRAATRAGLAMIRERYSAGSVEAGMRGAIGR